jgi:hypothetical protein
MSKLCRECPIDLSAIKPDPVGKYSPSLYRWFTGRTRDRKHLGFGIVCANKDEFRPPFAFQPGIRFDFWNGYHDADGLPCIMGVNVWWLMQGDRKSWAVPCRQPIDCTEWFWREYLRLGRCLFDPSHTMLWQNDGQRFIYPSPHTRVCQWCGQRQAAAVRRVVRHETDWSNKAVA